VEILSHLAIGSVYPFTTFKTIKRTAFNCKLRQILKFNSKLSQEEIRKFSDFYSCPIFVYHSDTTLTVEEFVGIASACLRVFETRPDFDELATIDAALWIILSSLQVQELSLVLLKALAHFETQVKTASRSFPA
jgi:hypothetical protein